MLSNYPPGVTGLEPQIAGGQYGGERTVTAEEVECGKCAEQTESVEIVAELEDGNLYGEWTCKCGYDNDWDADILDYTVEIEYDD